MSNWNKKSMKNSIANTSPWSDVDKGKKRYRLRVLEDKEADEEIEEVLVTYSKDSDESAD